MLQQGPPKANDAADLLIESIHRVVEIIDENGQMRRSIEPDDESLFWRLLEINNPNFGGAVYEIKKFERQLYSAADGLPFEMAMMIQDQGNKIAMAYRYAFASKSSETIRDKLTAQSSLMHQLLRDHAEKTVTIKDDAKKGLGQSLGLGGGGGNQQDQQPY